MASGLSAERAARNEAVFRAANERIAQRADELSVSEGRSPFLCECEQPLCTLPVRLTSQEYEAVRAHGRQFIVARGHADEDAEIVARHAEYEVVEKRGVQGAVADRLDPRRRTGTT